MFSSAKALLFDLDGTLIDSMPHHHEAWVRWHERRGLTIDGPAFFAATAGRSNAEILADLLPQHTTDEHEAMADEKEALYREIARQGLTLIAGAESFVATARQSGWRLAVCTASTLQNMALAFERDPIDGWVETVVSPADHRFGGGPNERLRGKPHPDIFLEAARRLGLAPADCIVFEDAPLGIEAARRAGMRAVALTTTMAAGAFAGLANVLAVVPDFTAIPLLTLSRANPHA